MKWISSAYIKLLMQRNRLLQGNSEYKLWKQTVEKVVDAMPSVDIVFCKDCKHRPIKEDADGVDWGFNIVAPEISSPCPCLVDDGWYSWMPKDNFFCGYGEREDE